MNKICGYSCEHNKGGVCQITRCIKMPLFTTTTYEPLRQQISNFQKENGVKVDDNLLLRKLYEENIKYKEVLDKIKEKVNQYELIKGYYDYIEENGYAETTSHDTLKEDILGLLEKIE